MWPAGTYDNLDFGKYYNPMKAKKNRFNIDAIYSQLSTLPWNPSFFFTSNTTNLI